MIYYIILLSFFLCFIWFHMFSITERETEKLIGVKRFNFDIINLFKAVIFNTYLFINSIDDEFNDDTNDEFNDDINNSYVKKNL